MARTVVIVDDSTRFRAAARGLLQSRGYEVVGEAADGESALEAIDGLQPQVVLLDVQLPDMDGFEVARRLTTSGCDAKVVLISARKERAYRNRLPASAALGFVHKAELSSGQLEQLLA